MDHKVSKDMISSGMIPSGEKTQADLSRTQYGSAPSPSKLMDAYKSMYEHHKKDADGNTIPHEGEELNEGKIPAGLQAYLDKKKGKKEDKKEVKEGIGAAAKLAFNAVKKLATKETAKKLAGNMATGAAMSAGSNLMSGGGGGQQKPKTGTRTTQYASADLFDIVKGQLLDEGYSEKEANEIMVNLTEEQLEEFMKALATRAAEYGANIGKKGSITGFLNRNPNKQSITPKEQGPIRPTGQKGVRDPKPGDTGFKPSPSQVLQDIKMRRKRQSTTDPKTKIVTNKGQVMQDNADLFDIVKGQLLDEGLSEEEIKDIMLTLTPDEIMEELSDNIKKIDAQNKANFIKRAKENPTSFKSQVPDKVREASKRQYKAGTPREDPKNPYTSDDRETIKNYYSKND